MSIELVDLRHHLTERENAMARSRPSEILDLPIGDVGRGTLEPNSVEIAKRCSQVQLGWTSAEKCRRHVEHRGLLLFLAG